MPDRNFSFVPIKANRKSTPRTLQFGCSKAEVQKGLFSSMSKPELYSRFRGKPDFCVVTRG
jgi:hypothetical protein